MRRIALGSSFTITLLLSALRAGAQGTPAPPAPLPPAAAPAATTTTSSLGAPPALTKVSLAHAIERALARNPSSVVAEAEIRRSEALVRQARAASFPTLTANGVYTRLDADRVLGEGAAARVISAKDSLSANLTLSVPLIAPQRWAQWSHAKDEVEATRATSGDVRRQIAVAAARAYLAVVAQRRVLEVNERARDTARAHLDFAKTRLAGGIGNRIDTVRAEQELMSDDAQVQVTFGGLVRAQEALGVVLGEQVPLDAEDEPQLPTGPTLDAALGDVQSQREDIKALNARSAAAAHQVRDGWTDYAPYLIGQFQPFYQNPPSLTQPTTGWQAQLLLTIPLYDGGLRYGLAEERSAKATEAKAAIESTLRQAQADVRASFEAMRRSDEALRSARQAASLAHQALELANLAYREGASTNLEVIDAERRARDAETAAAVAEDNARSARLDFLSASGRFP
jgi:outer membrane protein TolC